MYGNLAITKDAATPAPPRSTGRYLVHSLAAAAAFTRQRFLPCLYPNSRPRENDASAEAIDRVHCPRRRRRSGGANGLLLAVNRGIGGGGGEGKHYPTGAARARIDLADRAPAPPNTRPLVVRHRASRRPAARLVAARAGR